MNGLFFGGMCKYPDLDDSYCKGVVSEARLRLHNVFKAIGVDVRSLLCLLNFEFTFSHFIWGVLWHKAPSRPIQRGGPVPESVQRPGLSNDAHQNHHTCRKLPPLQLCKHFFLIRWVVFALEAQISEAPFILYGPAGAKVQVIISVNFRPIFTKQSGNPMGTCPI